MSRRYLLCCFLLLCVFSLMASAQVSTATLVGTAKDHTGAAVSGAQVTATNTGTNFSRSAKTDAQGEYRIEYLPVGTYSVEIAAPGFGKFIRNGVVLEIQQTARIDAALSVGGAAETVTVTEEAPPVNTSNAEVGRTIENREILELPLVDRNVYTLLDLTPGVQSNSGGTATAPSGSNPLVLGYPEQRTFINGGVDGGAGSVNYYLDGGTNMTGLRNTGNLTPNPDAVQEFRIQTNSYSAEFGHFSGGVINVLTKSGSNKWHGSLFEFVRNNAFNAYPWGLQTTLNSAGQTVQAPKPPLHRNQFGGTFGGPVKKDRSFFFFSYGGLRQITSTVFNSAIVPTALERTGDFSQSVTSSGAKVFISDPTRAGSCTATVNTSCFRDPARATAANPLGLNIIPANRIDATSMNILTKFIPLANSANNIFQGTLPNPFNTNEFLSKFDHELTRTQHLTLSYFETAGENSIRAGTGTLPWATQSFNWRQHNANVSDTWTVSPDKVNQVWLSYTRNFGGRLNLPATSLGDLGSAFTAQGTPSLPQITVTGFFTLTNAIGGPVAGTNFYSVRDVFSWSKGKHGLKFGAEESLNKDIQQTLLNNYGVFTFNGAQTKTNGMADFLIGIPSAISQDAPVTAYTNSWYTAFFAQDDFRVHPRLTLNLGVRWDIQTAPTDPVNKESTFIAGRQSTVRPDAPLGLLLPGDAGVERGIVPVRWHHVSPRIGFAWDPLGDGKTSIRGAAGVFYGSVSGNEWNTTSNFEPFAVRLSFTNTGSTTGATLSNPYRNLAGGDPFPYAGKFISAGPVFGIAPNFQWPYAYQMNFSVQREVMKDLTVTGAYVGTLSHNLPFASDINYPIINATASAAGANVQARRPNQAFSTILLMQSNQTADYHGFQLSVVKRMGHNFSINSFYTYSKTLDSVQLQNNTTQGGVQNFSKITEDRGRADTDQRHVFVASATWSLDYFHGENRIAKNVLNGWQLSPIVKLRSGLPFTILNGTDANFDGNSTDRAQQGGDPHVDNRGAFAWFNTAAFTKNAPPNGAPIDGSSPRSVLDGPGFRDIDLALSRNFNITEQVKLQFRTEASNAFNMVSLGTPGNTVGTGADSKGGQANFGVIRTASPTRQLQLGLRLTF